MDTVRFGVVGVGNMGGFHVSYLANREVDGAELTAVCDIDRAKLDKAVMGLEGGKSGGGKVKAFERYQDMLDSSAVNAIVIATPHYQHPEIAIAAFERNVHVMCEKPAAVGVKDARRMTDAAAKKPNLKYGLMFNQRTTSLYRKLRALIAEGELGDVTRVSWLITDWFRTWAYYASGGWRATWAGEGGGVLINQCPHNLDLIQWVTGMMPSRVTAVASVAKTHPIEVEDEVSAILEFPNGAVGHFVTTTGEAPGTNRLEIVGDRGKIVAENGKLTFHRTWKGVREIRETSPEAFAQIETWASDMPIPQGELSAG